MRVLLQTFLTICLLQVGKRESIVTPRYVCVSSKYVGFFFDDSDYVLFVVAVSVKYLRTPSVSEGVVTKLPLGFHLAHDRSKERGELRAVE